MAVRNAGGSSGNDKNGAGGGAPPAPTRGGPPPAGQQRPNMMMMAGSGSGGSNNKTMSSSARFEFLTEAVPLSLSSMAHASLALDDGVSDGIEQVLQHTLLSCVNYARIMHPPHQWTFRDLTTSKYAWRAVKKGSATEQGSSPPPPPPDDVPFALEKLKFVHQYTRNALIYLKAALLPDLTFESEMEIINKKNEWTKHVGILGRISLLYISTEPLTASELDGTDVDDIPPCILYKVLVEYRSLPATGNQQAVQAEELSMLSFGGSVDDNVKFGALASLYDPDAKYVLEIYSVRGKKYKFDLMDSTLSNGTIPRLPEGADPFVKSLCVTVSEHHDDDDVGGGKSGGHVGDNDEAAAANAGNSMNEDGEEKKYAVTRMHLLMEGKLRKGNNLDEIKFPSIDYVANGIKASFLSLNPKPPLMVTAMPSGHTLLLDPEFAGRIYVNGAYVTTWGMDPRIGSHGVALFGMDLHSIPMWHNSVVNYEDLKRAYALLWEEILIDARLVHLNIASRLLYRLMKGHDPPSVVKAAARKRSGSGETDDEDDDVGYDDDEYDDDDLEPPPSTAVDCLESQVLSASHYDRVGIAPKALATRFGIDFGSDAFPCLSHEVDWVRSMLPDRKPVVVPQRLINIIRRGGYFDVQRTSDDLWFASTRPPSGDDERELVESAIRMLEMAGCDDVSPEQIAFTNAPPAKDVVRMKLVCRYSVANEQYCIHEKFVNDVDVRQYLDEPSALANNKSNGAAVDVDAVRAYLLGMYIAKEHPDGRVLARYICRHSPSSLASSSSAGGDDTFFSC